MTSEHLPVRTHEADMLQPEPEPRREPEPSDPFEPSHTEPRPTGTFPEISSSMRHEHEPEHQVPQRPWKPRDRRQSWSQQDRKHALQSRLLEVKKGDESGFTEIEHGVEE